MGRWLRRLGWFSPLAAVAVSAGAAALFEVTSWEFFAYASDFGMAAFFVCTAAVLAAGIGHLRGRLRRALMLAGLGVAVAASPVVASGLANLTFANDPCYEFGTGSEVDPLPWIGTDEWPPGGLTCVLPGTGGATREVDLVAPADVLVVVAAQLGTLAAVVVRRRRLPPWLEAAAVGWGALYLVGAMGAVAAEFGPAFFLTALFLIPAAVAFDYILRARGPRLAPWAVLVVAYFAWFLTGFAFLWSGDGDAWLAIPAVAAAAAAGHGLSQWRLMMWPPGDASAPRA